MSSRQFGAPSRDMKAAARMIFQRSHESGALSFGSVDTHALRVSEFLDRCKVSGIGRMERIEPDMLIGYGLDLAERVEAGDLSCSYAQNRISSINTLMRIGTEGAWQSVSPTQDCRIPRRKLFRDTPPSGMDVALFNTAVDSLTGNGSNRPAALTKLCREFGLRTKESALLDPRKAIAQLMATGTIQIDRGTKGGRHRTVPADGEAHLPALEFALEQAGDDRCLVPPELTWQKWRDTHLNAARPTLKKYGIETFHDLRAAYACQRYQQLSGEAAPVCGGNKIDREVDLRVRLTIAEELGHGRVGVVAAYVGKVIR